MISGPNFAGCCGGGLPQLDGLGTVRFRVTTVVLPSPAKINLFLAVTGRRDDGFHDLVSVAAPLCWGDTLRVELADGFILECDEAAVPRDETNLVLKAARAFCAATGWKGGARFYLEKRIPIGAGLGGGSSNATTALVALNRLAGEPLDGSGLARVAAQVGSDCALFLHDGPVVMRGRGERLEVLAESGAAERLRGRRVLIFKPEFGISTPWAYRRLAAGAPEAYLSTEKAEVFVGAWLADRSRSAEQLLFNSLEGPAFEKYLALPTLLTQLRENFSLSARMSGSGSACFLLLADDFAAERLDEVVQTIRAAWGPGAFVVETRLG